MDHVDIAIVGGGPVGAALATGLEGSGLSVAILEARVLKNQKLEAPDPRALALSQGAHLILNRLGAWEALKPLPLKASMSRNAAGLAAPC